MWEIISANKRRSALLLAAMACCLLGLGYLIGLAWGGTAGAWPGLFIAGMVWIVLASISFASGDAILLAAGHAREITPDFNPQLFNVVEEMKIAANLPALPRIFVIDDPGLNAFATGVKPGKSAVAVTAGLLARLNRDELQGVIAHEISHIVNRDVLYMTLAGVMLGSVQLLGEIFLRGRVYSAGYSRRYRSSGTNASGGGAQAVILVLAVLLAILGPILARIFYFSLSRRREYLADASGVRLTRYPEGLASALGKIATQTGRLESANAVTAPMYISDPFNRPSSAFAGLFSTHPPIEDRIMILSRMARGVNFADYQKAYSEVLGTSAGPLPSSVLDREQPMPVRACQPPGGMQGPVEGPKAEREVLDMMRAVNQFRFLGCPCGLRMKVPPGFKPSKIRCPRCGKDVEIPGAAGSMPVGAGTEEKIFQYHRRGSGWETFACPCGAQLQISPAFNGESITCRSCGRKTAVGAQKGT